MDRKRNDAATAPLLLAIGLLSCASSALAEPDNSLEKGAWAVELQVRPTFLKGGDAGLGASLKRHLTDRNALRVGFFTQSDSDDHDQTLAQEESLPDTVITTMREIDGSRSNRSVSAFAHFVRYLGVGDRIAAFLEGGPTVQRNVSNVDDRIIDTGRTISRSAESREWRYGGEAQAGFEWFFKPRFSVGMRYGMWLVRTERTDASTDQFRAQTGETLTQRSWMSSKGFSSGTTAAMLSVIAYW